MKRIEHKVKPEVAAYAKQAMEQIGERRRRQLLLLGEASEIGQQIAVIGQALETTIGMVVQQDKLPPSKTPYSFTQDGSTIVGQTDDEERKGDS